MSPVRAFVYNLAVGGHTAKEILSEVKKSFGKSAMKKPQVYKIITEVKASGDGADLRGYNTPKRVRTPEVIASVEALVTSDRRLTLRELVEETGINKFTIHNEAGPPAL